MSAQSRTKAGPRVGPLAGRTSGPARLDVDALLADREVGIIVCCGSGGVGKTTTSAALGLRAAEQGRRVVVLTIDPARRLAQAMGLTKLDNTPRPVGGVDESNGGSLDAMMLDMKRTFDEVVESHASPQKAQQILSNPFYQALSSSFAGTQEYMAMEKLGQLHASARRSGGGDGGAGDDGGEGAGDDGWDLIVVDTPPSRSALDFLDAPERLASFLDGRFIRLMLVPAKGPARLLSAGLGVVTGALTKVLGTQLLRDAQTFIAAFDTLFGGFRARADETYKLLQADETAFVVVAAPQADALREAAYFVERLTEERMPLAGLVVNRVTHGHAPELSETSAAAGALRLEGAGEHPVTAHLLRLHADQMAALAREEHLRRRFTAAHPAVPVAEAQTLATDVHDLDGLREVGTAVSGAPASA